MEEERAMLSGEWRQITLEVATRILGNERAAELFLVAVHPCVLLNPSPITLVSDLLPLGTSKLGGGVDLPRGATPPVAPPGQEIWLVAQISLQNLPPGPWSSLGRRGMLYLYAEGDLPGDLLTFGRDRRLRVFADLWVPSEAELGNTPVSHVLVRHPFPWWSRLQGESSLACAKSEIPLALSPGFNVPDYATLWSFVHESPPEFRKQAEPYARLMETPPFDNVALYNDYVWDIVSEAARRGVPFSTDFNWLFGSPQDLAEEYIKAEDWFSGRLLQVFGAQYFGRWFHRIQDRFGECPFNLYDWLSLVEVYVERGPGGELCTDRQTMWIDWLR